MARVVIGAALIVAAAAAQVTWAAGLQVAGAYPNLVLLAIVAMAWARGVRPAMAWACAGGLLLDLASPGPLGPHAVALVTVAYLTGFWSRNLERRGAVHVALSAAFGTVVYSAVVVGLDGSLGSTVPGLESLARLTLAACVYNALLMPVAAALVRQMDVHRRPLEPA